MISVAKQKSNIRSHILLKRNEISSERRHNASKACAQALAGELTTIQKNPNEDIVIAGYFPLGSELSPLPFLESLDKGISIAMPVMLSNVGMQFFQVTPDELHEKTLPFFSHPAKPVSRDDISLIQRVQYSPDELDFIIVPLVAFSGNMRLGYGGGNYDIFFKELQQSPKCPKIIGIAFAEQEVAFLPIEDHDKPLQKILSF